jgi:hypothetical protein
MQGAHEFIQGLGPVKEIILHQIPTGQKIEPGTTVIIEKQSEFFSADLNTPVQLKDAQKVHFSPRIGLCRVRIQDVGRHPDGSDTQAQEEPLWRRLVDAADTVYGKLFDIDFFKDCGFLALPAIIDDHLFFFLLVFHLNSFLCLQFYCSHCQQTRLYQLPAGRFLCLDTAVGY